MNRGSNTICGLVFPALMLVGGSGVAVNRIEEVVSEAVQEPVHSQLDGVRMSSLPTEVLSNEEFLVGYLDSILSNIKTVDSDIAKTIDERFDDLI